MAKNTSAIKYDSLASLKTHLQGKLGRAEPERVSPPNFSWLRAPSHGWQALLTVEGADVVLRLADGRHYVGRIVRCSAHLLVLALWGCGGQLRRFALADVGGAAVVGPHTFEQERAVYQRQRRGEPAHMQQGPLKRERRGGIGKGEST